MLPLAREYFQMRVPARGGLGNLVFDSGSRAYTKEVSKALRNGHVWMWAERKLAGP